MFNSIKLYIYGIGAALLAVLFALVRYQSGKIDDLKHDAKIKDKVKENHDKQESDEKEVLGNEEQNIRTDLQKHRNGSRIDRSSRL